MWLVPLCLCPITFAQDRPRPTEPTVLFADLADRLEQPALAVSDDGTLALVFVADRKAVHVALREPGAPWGAPQLVAETPDIAVGMRRGPRIAWAGEALLVSWIDTRFDRETRKSTGSGNLTVRRSLDLGAHWSKPERVNGHDESAREGLHAMAASGSHAALIWIDPSGEPKGAKVFAAWSTDGGASFGRDLPVRISPSDSICPCCHPSLCIDADGRATLMWRDSIEGMRDMYLATLTARSERVVDPALIGAGHWQLDACPMDGGALALASDDRKVSVWRREDTVFWSLGTGSQRRLGSGRNASIAVSGTQALAAFERGGTIVAVPLSLEEPDTPALARELGAGAFPIVIALEDGHFAVFAERSVRRGMRLIEFEVVPR